MNVLDLFSGIAGFSLGLERAGFRTVAFCEIEPYCRAVLGKRWPTLPIYSDIRELNVGRLIADGVMANRPIPLECTGGTEPASADDIDVICGGFP